ncbi:hypothetical protein JEP15_09065 [Proteus sp. PR00174]|uniref:hypothetical protein n=1 Tax=Proteus TaxID=583 RepID=UPI0018E40E24|nr:MULTISPECIES: hypothetical protein [Proteus]MBI6511521.1 hypothetical protein [Proteus sp. PR00174]MDM3565043.1 hypothetical protein [Proteus vulgaris]
MIAVSISTTTSRVFNIKKEQFPIHPNISYFISIQGNTPDKNNIESYIKNHLPHFSIYYTNTVGLSNNRNNLLNKIYLNPNIDYIYISDDDIILNISGILNLKKEMLNNNVSIGVGKVITDSGYFKNYSKKSKKINFINSAKISSIEIMLKKDFFSSKNIFFDENFGLGSFFESGEEYIFCTDALKNKAKIVYFPIVLCKHPPISSGQLFYLDNDRIKAKGAMFYRIFRYNDMLFSILFSIKKYQLYKNRISFIDFFKLIREGKKEFLKRKKTF